MFAEFEKITHKMVEEGETLTSDILCKVYYDLNKQYFGEDMVLDEEIALEWARIPHFYNPFLCIPVCNRNFCCNSII